MAFGDATTRGYVIQLLQLLRMRVPAVRDYIMDSRRAEIMARLYAFARTGELSALKASGKAPKHEDFQVEVLNWFCMSKMFKMAGDEAVLRSLYTMRARLLSAPFGSRFITSDQPVALFHPHAAKCQGLAPVHPGVEVSLPLSSRAALVLDHGVGPSIEQQATSEEVLEINRRTAVMAQRYVFTAEAPEQAAQLVRDVQGLWAGFKYQHLVRDGYEGIELRFVGVGPRNNV